MEALVAGEALAGEVSRASLYRIIRLVFPESVSIAGSCSPLPP